LKRFSEDGLRLLKEYHWPGNTEELRRVLALVIRKRPAGEIRSEDLPEVFHPTSTGIGFERVLDSILAIKGFRIINDTHNQNRLVEFLLNHGGRPFSAADFQGLFRVGRETAGKLLHSLESAGLIEGIKGGRGIRTTRYRSLCGIPLE